MTGMLLSVSLMATAVPLCSQTFRYMFIIKVFINQLFPVFYWLRSAYIRTKISNRQTYQLLFCLTGSKKKHLSQNVHRVRESVCVHVHSRGGRQLGVCLYSSSSTVVVVWTIVYLTSYVIDWFP